ncbi:MAG: hypothetical protein PVG03_15705 [Desulfarculaceae bacterium]
MEGGGDGNDLEAITSLLRPYPSEEMHCYPVSPDVNAATNEDPELIEPLEADVGQAGFDFPDKAS